MTTEIRQELFDYLYKTFSLKDMDKVDMEELENIILKDYKKELIEKIKYEKIDYDTTNDIIELIDET